MREENQDRFVARRSGGVTLMAVADGVAGEAGGDVASAAAVEALSRSFEFGTRDAAAGLASAVRAANDAVLRAAAEQGHPTAASTLVAAAVRDRRLAVANLGDSRAYLIRDGSARQITSDHAGAVPNSITRFVGDPRGVAPDVFVEVMRPRDRVVLCSDGLTRHVAPEEIATRVGAAPPERAARSLVELANARGGEDNVTVVVYASPALTIGSGLALGLLLALVALVIAGALVALLASVPAPLPSATPLPSPSPSPLPSP